MKRPLVSVIISNYNNSKYLRECLDSVFNQVEVSFECIVIDDCSKDNSIDILNEYKNTHPNLIIIRHEENKGCGAARTTGLKHAIGKYIIFLDSDDCYTHNKYLHNLALEGNITNSDIIRSGYTDGKTNRIEYHKATISCKQEMINIMIAAWGKAITSICNTMFRRIIWSKITYSERPCVEDTPTYVAALMEANSISYIEDYGYYYRPNENSITHNLYPAKFQLFNALCIIDCARNCRRKGVVFCCDEHDAKSDFNLNATIFRWKRESFHPYEKYYDELMERFKEIND